MRSGFWGGLATFLLVVTPVLAGELNYTDGQTKWKSTQCVAPSPPPLLTQVNPETSANDMNVMVTQYNLYVNAAQAYMQCISEESQRDANATSQSIINAGQDAINDTQATVTKLGSLLQKK